MVWVLASCFYTERLWNSVARLPVEGPHSHLSCESTFCPDHRTDTQQGRRRRCQRVVLLYWNWMCKTGRYASKYARAQSHTNARLHARVNTHRAVPRKVCRVWEMNVLSQGQNIHACLMYPVWRKKTKCSICSRSQKHITFTQVLFTFKSKHLITFIFSTDLSFHALF